MKLPKIEPGHRYIGNDIINPADNFSIESLLDLYRRDPMAMNSLRLALFAISERAVYRMNDHEVLVLARGKLKTGQLKAKKDVCDKKDDKNRKYRNFIDAHRIDAMKIAVMLQNKVENILGLSALESTFGTSRFVFDTKTKIAGNNFFGLHTGGAPLPNQQGVTPAAGDPKVGMAQYGSFFACAESFAKTKGRLVIGITDPKQFATILQKEGKFGIGPNGPLPSYVSDLVNVIGNVVGRLNCA